MPVSPSRQAAYRILLRVEAGRGFAVDLLQGPGVSALKEADRRLATEIVMGALRWRGELDYRLAKLSGKKLSYFDPEIAAILRLSLYQILFLAKIPKSAVVNEAVELAKAARKKSAAGLVNAVLRKCEPSRGLRRREGTGEEPSHPNEEILAAAVRSLPPWLAEGWARHFGTAPAESLAWASVCVPPVTLRINASAGEREETRQRFLREGITARLGRYSSMALVVESGSPQSSELLRRGQAIVQDEASQVVASLVAPRTGDRVLDLCAAPGIKTSQLAGDQREGLLVGCDISGPRLRTMKQVTSMLLPESVRLNLIRLDAASELPFRIQFDRILVDAPCSGTGTLARNPEIKLRLAAKDLVRLGELQSRILRNALRMLAPGGRLVYATCSLEPEENERVVESALQSDGSARLVSARELSDEFPLLSPLFDSEGYLRTRPDLHGMDGFFAAVVRKVEFRN
ncbi:MAG: 16S rRNA (cytosine(967)-C(5))-methyltransferase RsmB [Terriglobia bacterium]